MLAVLLAVLTITGLMGDGGVGAGHLVTVHHDDVLVAQGQTDGLSHVDLEVDTLGIHDIEIHVPRTYFWYWTCRDRYVPVDTAHEFVTIRCVRTWHLALPNLWRDIPR